MLTYGDFYRSGLQDCSNTIDLSNFDLKALQLGSSPTAVVSATWKSWEDDGLEQNWREQQDFEDLDPHRAYAKWRDGWQACAIDKLSAYVADQKISTDVETYLHRPGRTR